MKIFTNLTTSFFIKFCNKKISKYYFIIEKETLASKKCSDIISRKRALCLSDSKFLQKRSKDWLHSNFENVYNEMLSHDNNIAKAEEEILFLQSTMQKVSNI